MGNTVECFSRDVREKPEKAWVSKAQQQQEWEQPDGSRGAEASQEPGSRRSGSRRFSGIFMRPSFSIARFGWINELLALLWPSISEYFETMLRTSIEPAIQKAVPWALRGVHFESIDLGREPIQFNNGHILRYENDRKDTAVHNLEVQMDLIYEGDASILLAVSGARIGVSSIKVRGPMVICLHHLIPRPPFIFGLSIFFPNPPTLEMEWRGIANVLKGMPVLPSMAREVALRHLCSYMVLPNRLVKILDDADKKADVFWLSRPHFSGVLRVEVLQAERLPIGDVSWVPGLAGSSDPYVSVTLGAQEWRTSYKTKTLDPVWDGEAHDFLVDCEEMQAVRFVVLDHDVVGEDDFLGDVSVPVAELLTRREPLWLELIGTDNALKLGSRLLVRTIWRPLVADRAKAVAVPQQSSGAVTCLLFVGVYAAEGVPELGTEGKYWLEMSVGTDVQATARVEAELPGLTHQALEAQARKVRDLVEAGVDPETVARVLEVPLQSVLDMRADVERGVLSTSKIKVTATATWEAPFTFFLTDLHHSSVSFKLMSNVPVSVAPDDMSMSPSRSRGSACKEHRVCEASYWVPDILGQEALETTAVLALDIAGCPNPALRVNLGLFVLDEQPLGGESEGSA